MCRALVMVCDLLTLVLVPAAIEILIHAVLLYELDLRDLIIKDPWTGEISLGVVLAVFLVSVLWTGRTPGDMAVQLRYTGGRLPVFLARVLRFAGGIGGYGLLELAGWPGAASLFALVTFGAWIFTAQGRGLPGILSGQELVDQRSLESDPKSSTLTT